MSEHSPIQSSVGVFVEWAKARLDEMAASAKVLDSRLDSLDVNVRAQAEQTIAHVKQWIAEGQADIKDVQAKGAGSIAEARAQMDATWSKFQSESSRWAELTKDQQATFQARAQAQAEAWQNVVNSYMQRATELHARNQKQAEAHVQQLTAEAQKAQADLKAKADNLGKAGQASWAAMSQALDESRNAFSKAIEVAAKRFDEAAKG
ncbi:MAG TPA: hypothetical protein VMW68_05840 [Methyloceanibacter sp.]|nr:hypothetical protein [Methyloceanibacter sp.]